MEIILLAYAWFCIKTLKWKKKKLKINYPIKTNFRPKLSLWLLVIVSIILFDKFVDAMGLNENHLICIFMNINENDENQDLQRENNYIAIWRVWFGL